jgi:hypothetical protein
VPAGPAFKELMHEFGGADQQEQLRAGGENPASRGNAVHRQGNGEQIEERQPRRRCETRLQPEEQHADERDAVDDLKSVPNVRRARRVAFAAATNGSAPTCTR